MASVPTEITVKVRFDDKELRAIRDWMGNAQAAISALATRCTHEEQRSLTSFLVAMEAAGAVLWESRE